MPTPTIKTKVAMDGEKEYKQALSEINSGLKVLNSEMKLTSEQFADNANSIEALTAKNDVLERQILSQKEKVDALKAALQSSAEAYGESDSRTAKWKVSLNEAEAQLIKMERELRDNQEALEKNSAAMSDMSGNLDEVSNSLEGTSEDAEKNVSIMDKLRDAFGDAGGEGKSLGEMAEDLAGKLGINLPDGAKNALDALGDINVKSAALAGTAAAAAAAIVKIEEALIGITTERAAVATSISNIAQTINMNVEATQQWDYVLKTVGSSIEEAQGDLSSFQEKIMEARTGTGEASEMFAKLGVSVVDQNGALRDTESVLLDTIHALQIMTDETERNAISSTLLGGTGEKLIPIYNQNAESLNYLLEKKKELGILTGTEIETLKDVSEALIDYEERVSRAKDVISVEFAPALENFYEAAGTGILNLGQASEQSGLINFLGSILDIVSALTPALEVLGTVVSSLGPVFNIAAVVLSTFADTLEIVLNLASALVNLIGLDFSAVRENFQTIGAIWSGNDSASSRALANAFNASGNYNFDGGYTWVGENGPELAYLPQGTRIYNNQESREMGGDTFYVTIDAKNVKEFNDIVEMARTKRRKDRMEAGK